MNLQNALPDATLISYAPGRVNLLGEHVDYNGGPVMPIAINRFVQVAARESSDETVEITALDLKESCRFHIKELDRKVDTRGNPLPGWALFPAGVAWALRQHGLRVAGIRAVFNSTVPIGAGLSSSAAVEVAFAALWEVFGGWHIDRLLMAQYAQQAESRYVGVNCGLMDQFACANGVEGHVLFFDTKTLAWEALPLPADCVVIVADSTMRRRLAGSAYNERRQSCKKALEFIQKKMPTIQHLSEISPSEFTRLSVELDDKTCKYARHVIEECSRVRQAYQALKIDDSGSFGRLMLEGHRSLRDYYAVSTPELDALVEIARWLPGCYGARLTGAGFGGCTVNLVDQRHAERFIIDLKLDFLNATGRMAEVFMCRPSQGVRVVML